MRIAQVIRSGVLAGTLTQENKNNYIFRYDDKYYINDAQPAISLTFPKTQQEYRSNHLFSFFFNMLSEGENRKLQCQQLRIDEHDYFSLLLATANNETVGAVTVIPIN